MDDVDAALAKAARLRARVADCIERAEVAAVEAYEAGASLSQVGKALGITGEGARRMLARRNVTMRPKHKHHGSGQQ